MWRNTDTLGFVAWLRDYNAALAPDARVGFYGLDVYSLFASIDAVLTYLERVDPEAAARARERYDCFMDFADDSRAYGHAAHFDLVERCEDDVVAQLVEVRRHAAERERHDGRSAADDAFAAEQNARVVLNAERYYRTMYRGRVASWNLRDRHMVETLDAVANHLARWHGRGAKLVVWAHNSHLGDARATERAERGQLNVGQLVRERFGRDAVLVGFTTHGGTVTAASDWGMAPERKPVRESRPDSYERLFHEVAGAGVPNFVLGLRREVAGKAALSTLAVERLERAIGVVYRPGTERVSHYLRARLTEQFDAVLHFDVTSALEPLERSPVWDTSEPPETYPSGM
jgi:erythromycin esterase-like protein